MAGKITRPMRLLKCKNRAGAGNDAQYIDFDESNAGGHVHNTGLRTRQTRPPARYPAAFENVIGVGAVPKNSAPIRDLLTGKEKHNPARYSNQSDVPPQNGIVTLGGSRDEENGVLGVFIHKFPANEKEETNSIDNTTGWAWWAGTSFAAAIISGILAKAIGSLKVWDAKSASDLLRGGVLSMIKDETRDAKEKVILVDQS